MIPPGAGPASVGRQRLDADAEDQPPPGQEPIVMAALLIGMLLMGIQLWLLTVALDLYLAGKGREIWQLAVVSGLIFLGGLLMTRFLHRRPRIRRLSG